MTSLPPPRPAPPPSSRPTSPPASDAKLPRLWPGFILLGAGVALGVLGIVLFIVTIVSGLVGLRAHETPATIVIECHAGDYYVYQETFGYERDSGAPLSGPESVTMVPSQVRVTGPGGLQPTTWQGDGSESLSVGSLSYASAVGFHVSVPGRYSVHVASVSPPLVVVAPSLGSQFVRAAKWIILIVVGGLVLIAGVILLIVAGVRRGRAKKAASLVAWAGPAQPAWPGPWGYGPPPGPGYMYGAPPGPGYPPPQPPPAPPPGAPPPGGPPPAHGA